jgi:transcriptional regulator with XRE-family HTH domain/Zn-dependent peptidase ImmA (M78 family)
MAAATIGFRLKALREQRNLSQDEIARQFGFRDRQTLSAIEIGERRVTAEELLKAAGLFGVPLEYFTDPFLLAGEGRFSWRQNGVSGKALAEYEVDAGRLIAAFRELGMKTGADGALFRPTLKLDAQSDFEIATETGERFAVECKLGPVPAARLAGVMERELGILVLMVNPIDGVSGAACRLPELDAVLINRREAPGRRHFDLAHELFHILTWDAMPPEHIEEVAPVRRSRVETLADNFASALLMPAKIVDAMANWVTLSGDALISQLNAAADELQVTSSALRWRLVGMGRLGKIIAGRIPEDRLRNNGHAKPPKGPLPPLFSKAFVEVIARAIDEGRVTVRRLSYLLGLSIDEIAELFTTWGVKAPFEL